MNPGHQKKKKLLLGPLRIFLIVTYNEKKIIIII